LERLCVNPTGKQPVRDDAISSRATLVSEHGTCCGAGRTEDGAAHQIVGPHRPMQRPCAGVRTTCADTPRAMAGKCVSRERTSRQAWVVSANDACSTTPIWRGLPESRFLICPHATAALWQSSWRSSQGRPKCSDRVTRSLARKLNLRRSPETEFVPK